MELVISECVPLRRRRNPNRPPWMSKEIMCTVRKKKRLWKRDKHKEDKTKYKEHEKLVRNLIRRAKKEFEKRLAEGGSYNKKPFYEYVKNKTKSKQSVGPLKNSSGEKGPAMKAWQASSTTLSERPSRGKTRPTYRIRTSSTRAGS
jgi:hypothetical protein